MIAVILGTRAEFLRCVPLLKNLETEKLDYYLILTGQNLVDDIMENFGIKSENRIQLRTFQGISTSPLMAIKRTPALVVELRQILRKMKPTYIVYHGDTLTTLAGALASSGLGFRTAHIEAGFRSHSFLEPFPEEFFRVVADYKSDILFSPSTNATENLVHEKVKGKIIQSGSTVFDVVNMALEIIGKSFRRKDYVFFTAHRFENVFFKSRLKRIIEMLSLIKIPIYWPLHDITKAQLKKFDLLKEIEKTNVNLLPLMSYLDSMKLFSNCNYVITDGGSIEEESIILNKPCLLLRKRTERIEGLRLGTIFLTKLDYNLTCQLIKKVEKLDVNILHNPYVFDEKPTKCIFNYLKKECDEL